MLVGCGTIRQLSATATPTLTPPPGPTATPLPTGIPPVSELGTAKNPFILAMPPSPRPSDEVLQAGKNLVSLLEKATGYAFVPVMPPSEADLVNGFGTGSAHIGVLSPFAYLLAREQGFAEAAFAREHDKAIFYGAQFIANSGGGFKSYYDPVADANTAEATVALSQFIDKKPCWSDNHSPSGYIVPLGYLKQVSIKTRDPAFLAGHVAVVRALYASGICDFGATYIDARTYPGLEDQYPDLVKKVEVIWRVPEIIPYETLVFVHGLDDTHRRALTRAFVDLEGTPQGLSAMQTLYGFDAMQVVQDSQYNDFREMVKASGIDLEALVK
ncbi:MAG: phosphate/phosphite/phosphonate ABC transporter substrate-binding protein [Anaerolineae bacterium]